MRRRRWRPAAGSTSTAGLKDRTWSSRSATMGAVSIRRLSAVCSIRSSRPSARASGSGWSTQSRSSKDTEAGSRCNHAGPRARVLASLCQSTMADILIVDDDRSIATAFERFLKHEGHACTIASNAADAVDLIERHDPDLVMMDIRMPGLDGLQALQQLRARFPDLYVVMMTAYGTSQTSIDAIRGGAFEYLTKPLDLNVLRSVIDRALAARRSRNQD